MKAGRDRAPGSALPEERDGLQESRYESSPEWPFCWRRFRPFAYGDAAILEWRTADGWYAMLASIIPEVLADEIQKHQSSWYKAVSLTTAEALYTAIPTIYPRCNAIEGNPIPGVGKFDIGSWKEKNMPVMTQTNWWMLGLTISKKDPIGLRSIFDLCQNKLGMA